MRPVPLEIVIQSFDIANLEARMSAMARPAYTAVSNTLKEAATPADAKSAILFVPTRKQARLTALDLLTHAAADGEPNKFLQVGLMSCARPLSVLAQCAKSSESGENLQMGALCTRVPLSASVPPRCHCTRTGAQRRSNGAIVQSLILYARLWKPEVSCIAMCSWRRPT